MYDFSSRLQRAASLVALLIVAACAVALTGSLLRPYFTWGHDLAAHPTHAFFFDRAFRQGQLPVRWVEWVQDGYGQPLFNFYQVGYYYLVELVHLAGPSLSFSVKFTVVLLWLTGGAFMLLWLKPFGLMPATLGASVFMWSPYLMLDAYVRNAYPELMAIALAPGVLWSIDRLVETGRRRFVFTLALTTCLVLIAHLPAALILAPVFLGYTLAGLRSFATSERSGATSIGVGRRVLMLAMSVGLGIGMAAFYVLPAIGELGMIGIGRLTTEYYDYHMHFVRPHQWFDWSWGFGPSGVEAGWAMSLQIGPAQWIAIAVALAVVAQAAVRGRRTRLATMLAGWLIATGGAMFMMTRASLPIWDAVGPLAYLQFPWRFLMVPAIAGAAIAALLLSKIRNQTIQAIIVILAAAMQWQTSDACLHAAWNDTRADIRIDDAAWPSSDNGGSWAFRESGYDPISVTREVQNAPGRWVITDGSGAITPVSVKDAEIQLAVLSDDPLRLRLNEPFFPGWTILLDGREVVPQILAASGYMEITVPAGAHRVDAEFRSTGLRRVADLVSAFSALACLGIILIRRL